MVNGWARADVANNAIATNNEILMTPSPDVVQLESPVSSQISL
jgi:hypothetical protein